MLSKYYQDSDISMSKEAYFEMCDQLGMEPEEEFIPIEITDFPELVYATILVYNKLRDIWDPMGGRYLGKDYVLVFDMFKLYNIEDQEEQILAMEFLSTIDIARIKIISDKVTTQAASKTPKPR